MADRSPKVESAPTQPPLKPVQETASSVDDQTAGLGASVGSDGDGLDFLAKAQAKDELGRLDHFRILKELGRGGMGCVLLAEDTGLERQVALKVMLPRFAQDEKAKSRFLREARAAGKLQHDHVVTIHAVGESNGVPYIAMEFLKGAPLDKYLKEKGDLPLPAVLRIGREIALGLQAAHKLGMIHRDIKPANVWLEAPKGRVKILDFGLARREEDGEAHLTQSGAIVGTPAYMAPEQASGEKLDGRADLFSLGVLLYRLTTGQAAFSGPTTTAMLLQVMTHEPGLASEVKATVPLEMARIIAKLMAKKREDRYASAAEFIGEWERLMKSPKPEAATEVSVKSNEPRPSGPSGSGKQVSARDATPLLGGRGPVVGKRLIAVGVGFVALSLLAWQILIRITDEKGNVKEIEVPKGGKVEIVEKPGPKKLPEEKKPNVVNPPPAYVPMTLAEKEAKKQQADWSSKLKVPVEEKSKSGIVMVLIPPGGEALPKPYLLGKYEVTQGEWGAVMGYNPSYFNKSRPEVKGLDVSRFPVEQVSWYDSVEYCNKLSEGEGLKPYYELTVTKRTQVGGKQIEEAEVKILGGNGYHIPTDAEWEHGCRAGTKTRYHCGDSDEDLLEYAWFEKNSEKRSHAVGEKKPNGFGLYDMHGNVREWNEEMLTNATTGAPERVNRGGHWSGFAGNCAVSSRYRYGPAHRSHYSGLRLARVP